MEASGFSHGASWAKGYFLGPDLILDMCIHTHLFYLLFILSWIISTNVLYFQAPFWSAICIYSIYLEPAWRRTNVIAEWLPDHKWGGGKWDTIYIIFATSSCLPREVFSLFCFPSELYHPFFKLAYLRRAESLRLYDLSFPGPGAFHRSTDLSHGALGTISASLPLEFPKASQNFISPDTEIYWGLS